MEIRSRKARALLGMLAASADLSATRARICALLWGDRGEAQARASLRQELAGLRRILPPGILEAGPERVRLVPEAVRTDIATLTGPGPADVIGVAGGRFLDDLDMQDPAFEDWLSDTRRALDMRVAEALRAAAERSRATGDWIALEQAARRLLALDGYDEAALAHLMTALDRQGRRAQALDAFREFEGRLAADLGTQAGEPLAQVAAAVARGGGPAPTPEPEGEAAGPGEVGEVFRRPAVLLLPFGSLGATPDDELLAAGLCEDIRTSLACWRWFPVIGPEALARADVAGEDIKRLAASVDAAYVVTGAVRRAGARVRVTAHLVDGTTGRQLWSQNFDGELSDVFAFQEEIAQRIVGQVEPEIRRAAQTRIANARPDDLNVWELLLKAADAERRGGEGYGTPAANEEEKGYLRQALALDPGSAEAWARLSRCFWRETLMGWDPDREAALANCLDAGAKALALNPEHSIARSVHAVALLFGRNDAVSAREHAEQSVRLNPSSPLAHHVMGCVLEFSGEPAEALPHLEAIFRLNPNYENASAIYCDMMMCEALLGKFDRAVPLARKVLAIAPNYARGLQRCAAVLAQAGEMDEARRVLADMAARGMAFTEDYIRSTYPFQHRADADFLIDGLKKAGWTG